jgi:hypothetical protein
MVMSIVVQMKMGDKCPKSKVSYIRGLICTHVAPFEFHMLYEFLAAFYCQVLLMKAIYSVVHRVNIISFTLFGLSPQLFLKFS